MKQIMMYKIMGIKFKKKDVHEFMAPSGNINNAI